MQESHDEGVANHIGPESCVSAREVAREALTGGSAGRGMELRKHTNFRTPTFMVAGGRQHSEQRQRELLWGPARSKTLCTYGHISSRNREIPCLSTGAEVDRFGKSQGQRQR